MPISNSKETIDERVLRLLGLEDVFDLDYDTYLILLKEAMVKGRMTKKTIPTEEIMLLTDEYKRVRSKKDSGRFEVKKKKISAGSFSVGSVKGKLTGAKATKALPPAKVLGQSPLSKSLEDNISAITSAVISISETLKAQKKMSDSSSSYDRRKAEQDKRALAESNLEKRFGGLKKAAEKIIAPVKSLLDRLLNFLTTIILGRVLYKFIDWLADPKNASKVKSVIRFLGDWWPALLGAYVLFGTTFGKFIRGTVGMLGRFIFQIGRVAIPQLLKFIKSPLGIGAALFTAGATIPALFPGTVNEQERKTEKAPGTTEDKIKALQQQKANLNFFDKLQGKGSEIDEQISFLKTGKTKSYGFSGGGAVNGYVSGEKGVDKVPAMLSDGEFVMSRGAVQQYGVDALEAMNAAAGGTNRPKVVSGVPHAYGGGLIGKDPGEGGIKSGSNTPFVKDPFGAINRFINFKFGADVGKRSTWGIPMPGSSSKPVQTGRGSVSSGSLLSDPVGAVARIANNMGIQTPNVPSSKPKSSGGNALSRIMDAAKQRFSGGGAPKQKGEKGFFENLQSATFRDAGSIYAKQMLGGVGGPISEKDLSGESQAELQKAIQRAKKRTGSEIAKAEAKIKELRSMGAKDGNPALETQKSFLKKLKSGGVRVQYTDYAENGKMTESAKNAKNILGQFWAYGRSEKEGGGYRIEDKYDFDKMKDPMKVLTGKGSSIQQRLQALYQMNPFASKGSGGDVDMVLGGKRSKPDAASLIAKRSIMSSPIGILGGLVANANKPSVVSRQKPRTRPVKPPTNQKPKVVYGPPVPKKRNKRGGGTTQRTPAFSATTKGMRSKQETLGLMR
jgi:hypothetical protein